MRASEVIPEVVDNFNSTKIISIVNQNFVVFAPITISSKGEVNIEGDCIIKKGSRFDYFPIKFGVVKGDFDCSNAGLISLKGSPKVIGGYFLCDHNKLSNLIGCPGRIKSFLSCDHNNLTSLKGCPALISGNFMCTHNKLTTLVDGPHDVNGYFNCSDNPLVTLEGLPSRIEFGVYVSWTTDLPLLRLLSYSEVALSIPGQRDLPDDLKHLETILRKYLGDGNLRKRIIACQKELIDAGFEGNASW